LQLDNGGLSLRHFNWKRSGFIIKGICVNKTILPTNMNRPRADSEAAIKISHNEPPTLATVLKIFLDKL
jgi:hypothetical protein